MVISSGGSSFAGITLNVSTSGLLMKFVIATAANAVTHAYQNSDANAEVADAARGS